MSTETLVKSGSGSGGGGTPDHLRADDSGDERDWQEWEQQATGAYPDTLALPDVGIRAASVRRASGSLALGRFRSGDFVPRLPAGPNIAALAMHAIRFERPE